MSRQQKRADNRAAVKAVRAAAQAVKSGNAGIVKGRSGGPHEMHWDEMSDRQRRGFDLWLRSESKNGMAILLTDDVTLWSSATDPNRTYRVTREDRNRRGEWVVDFTCSCEDYKKQGRVECKHIVAEQLRRGLTSIVGIPSKKQRAKPDIVAQRRPARQRLAHDGSTIRTSQRRARMAMPARIPELLASLNRAFDRDSRGIVLPIRRGPRLAPLSTRALALVAKVSYGASADEMMFEYDRMIERGVLRLKQAPSQNSLSIWLNDEELTPVLREYLRLSAYPFREREIGGIIDSSKVSQLMIAHAKEVEYGNRDERPNADWMKCHALVGVETMVIMAAEFSGTLGEGTHDVNFIERLVIGATATFPLHFLLGDKAYLSESVLKWLWDQGIRACIPVKKKVFKAGTFSEPVQALVKWFDENNNRDFHEVYRLRPKVEALFSLLKRTADGFCWSRGRPRNTDNAHEPCTAWVNEVLCKFIYLNLRTTVLLEHETGVVVDYLLPSRRFPAPDEPLLKQSA